jgi:hypothetical protein
MSVICPEVKELSAEESRRLALLRDVFERMRAGELKLGFHSLAAGAIGSPQLTVCARSMSANCRMHAFRS